MRNNEGNRKMSKECRYFVQHAWKKDLCANCFESREDHLRKTPHAKPNAVKDTKNIQGRSGLAGLGNAEVRNLVFTGFATCSQGILRERQTTSDVTTVQRKRNRVVFPDTLSEIIGYGGDDFSDVESEPDPSSNDVEIVERNQPFGEEEKGNDEDQVDQEVDWGPDSEEDRALNNLTRANTNFNTVTANLMTSPSTGETKKPHTSLMLGKTHKDSEGKKTTLLISVTPFGADDSIPTAQRPVERKRIDGRSVSLEKIVDMPLIAPCNLMAPIKKPEPSQSSIPTDVPSNNKTPNNIIKAETNETPIEIRPSPETKENLVKEEKANIPSINQTEDFSEELGERTVEGESQSIDNIEKDLETPMIQDNSREDAGAPDGKADEDEESISMECASIVSAEPRRSFLHSETVAKKPIISTKPMVERMVLEQKELVDAFNPITECTIVPPAIPTKSNTFEFISTITKDESSSFDTQSIGICKRRMAPKPPEVGSDDTSGPLFARKPNFKSNLKSDSPVVREKEKRERASSSHSPKLKKSMDSYQNTSEVSNNCNSLDEELSETPSLRTGAGTSYSQLNIVSPPVTVDKYEEKKKTKSRFSLKKLLRMGGSRKDLNLVSTMSFSTTKVDDISAGMLPKPRLEIIHPLELDGAAVEVLRHDKLVKSNDEFSFSDSRHESSHNVTARLGKPPPPPRNGQSMIDSGLQHQMSKSAVKPSSPNLENVTKPSSTRTWQTTRQHTSPVAGDSIYANLAAENVAGEVRSGMAPSKPQRTASMRRENETLNNNDQSSTRNFVSVRDYTKFSCDVPQNTDSLDSALSECQDAYELLSSSPECDSNPELRHQKNVTPTRANVTIKRNSEGCVSNVGHYRQYKCNKLTTARSNSLPYCGSETESELSTPDGFYIGNEGAEEDHDWKGKNEEYSMARIRQRRNRSVVHRSLEDNYGAVVVANHESLAQMLERLSQGDSLIPVSLRNLNASNPRLRDFTIDIDSTRLIGKRTFCSASWNENAVTLCLSLDGLSSSILSHKEFCLMPIIEFVDKISNEILPSHLSSEMRNGDVTVSVLPALRISTIKCFLSLLLKEHDQHNNNNNENLNRECCLVLLQVVNALKNLQARGIEELPKSLNNFVLGRDERDSFYRLYHLQSLHTDHTSDDRKEQISLCQSALVVLKELSLVEKFPVIRDLLVRERAVSLSQVKSVLEYSLWGPSDVTLEVWKEREIVLQRWLDLERATILHALVRTRPPLTIVDEYQLMFLVNTTAKNMCEASVLLDEQRSKLSSFKQNT